MSDNKFNKYDFGFNTSGPSDSTIVHIGEVLSTDDPLNAGRIKVKILPFDKDSSIFCKQRKNNGGKKNKYYKKFE